jgi:hypothetical protein
MNMRPKTNRPLLYLASALGLGAVIGWSSPSNADIRRIVIDQTATINFTPITMGTATPGTPTSYTVYVGRSFGDVNPSDPSNAIITDISLAPKNAAGRVEYVANFQIITPTNPAERNGLMIHSVPNRGGNSIGTTTMQQGVTYVQSGWQGDLLAQCSPSPAIPYPCFALNSGPYGSLDTTTGVFTPPQVPDVAAAGGLKTLAGFVAQVPVVTNGVGQPPISGQVYGHVCTGTNGCGLAVGSVPTSTAPFWFRCPISGSRTGGLRWRLHLCRRSSFCRKFLLLWRFRHWHRGIAGSPAHAAPASGATPGNSIFAGARTMGRGTEFINASACGPRSTRLRAASIFFTIKANGFSSRFFRCRRR